MQNRSYKDIEEATKKVHIIYFISVDLLYWALLRTSSPDLQGSAQSSDLVHHFV
jgi:hypothetical protein